MKHVYSILEVSPDNTEHNTGKTIEVEEPVFNTGGGLVSSRKALIIPLFAAYGFNKYVDSFVIQGPSSRDKMLITYGGILTWVLKRGR